MLHDLNLATQHSFIQKLISQWKDLPTISIKIVFKKSLNIQLIVILLLAAILKKVKVLIWTKRGLSHDSYHTAGIIYPFTYSRAFALVTKLLVWEGIWKAEKKFLVLFLCFWKTNNLASKRDVKRNATLSSFLRTSFSSEKNWLVHTWTENVQWR